MKKYLYMLSAAVVTGAVRVKVFSSSVYSFVRRGNNIYILRDLSQGQESSPDSALLIT